MKTAEQANAVLPPPTTTSNGSETAEQPHSQADPPTVRLLGRTHRSRLETGRRGRDVDGLVPHLRGTSKGREGHLSCEVPLRSKGSQPRG